MLVRKLIKLPHKPAVIVVHWWGPKHDCLELLTQAEANVRAQQHADHTCAMTLWNSTEDRIQTIVQHYGIQVQSALRPCASQATVVLYIECRLSGVD